MTMEHEEVMTLSEKPENEVLPTDRIIGSTEAQEKAPITANYKTQTLHWWDAYWRPATGERFRIYAEYDPKVYDPRKKIGKEVNQNGNKETATAPRHGG